MLQRWCDAAAAGQALWVMMATMSIAGAAFADVVVPWLGRETSNILQVPGTFATIQAAIDAADDDDLVLVGPGIYHEQVDFLGKRIEVRSTDGAGTTILDGSSVNGSIVLMLEDEPEGAALRGFTIRNGQGTPFGPNRLGGAILAVEAEATISDCVFLDNEASGAGGAIGLIGGRMRIERCVFRNNEAGFGDGGGAIWMSGSPGTVIEACSFIANEAGFFGGAISNVNSSPLIVNCLFTGNEAAQGGAIRNSASSPAVIHCTVAYNTADDDFETTGGGMRSSLGQSQPVVRGSIFWRNEPSEIIDLAGAETAVSCSMVEGWDLAPTLCRIDVGDPLFLDPLGPDGEPGTGDENMRLAVHSPAVDRGDGAAIPDETATDLDGNPRFVDAIQAPASAIVDLGPYERQNVDPADIDGNGSIDGEDLFVILSTWGPCQPESPCPGDLNGDGVVDAEDIMQLLGAWMG